MKTRIAFGAIAAGLLGLGLGAPTARADWIEDARKEKAAEAAKEEAERKAKKEADAKEEADKKAAAGKSIQEMMEDSKKAKEAEAAALKAKMMEKGPGIPTGETSMEKMMREAREKQTAEQKAKDGPGLLDKITNKANELRDSVRKGFDNLIKPKEEEKEETLLDKYKKQEAAKKAAEGESVEEKMKRLLNKK